jgi:hypothetical protein
VVERKSKLRALLAAPLEKRAATSVRIALLKRKLGAEKQKKGGKQQLPALGSI